MLGLSSTVLICTSFERWPFACMTSRTMITAQNKKWYKIDLRLRFPAALQKKSALIRHSGAIEQPAACEAIPSWSTLGIDGSLVISDALTLSFARPVSATSKEAEWLPHAFPWKYFNVLHRYILEALPFFLFFPHGALEGTCFFFFW